MKKLILSLALAPACAGAIRPVQTSTEQKIWVLRGEDGVYRCADAAPADQPPNPVCIRARILEGAK